ncbi:hypothetical protein WDZ92_35120 [Nostoc sp. NIES-2111]
MAEGIVVEDGETFYKLPPVYLFTRLLEHGKVELSVSIEPYRLAGYIGGVLHGDRGTDELRIPVDIDHLIRGGAFDGDKAHMSAVATKLGVVANTLADWSEAD